MEVNFVQPFVARLLGRTACEQQEVLERLSKIARDRAALMSPQIFDLLGHMGHVETVVFAERTQPRRVILGPGIEVALGEIVRRRVRHLCLRHP